MTDFDPECDKLTDQPPTAPEVPHADLIARLREWQRDARTRIQRQDAKEAADALAALGDTVPSEQWDNERFLNAARDSAERERDFAQAQRDEARAERDALAHVIEQVRGTCTLNDDGWYVVDDEALDAILDTAPAISLALHDAEVKAQALDGFAQDLIDHGLDLAAAGYANDQAKAIREGRA